VSARVQNVVGGSGTLEEDYAEEMVEETTDAGDNYERHDETLDEIPKHDCDGHGCWWREWVVDVALSKRSDRL
jgi:hypothetical protein